ncbi:hypothetical protein NUM_52050 [Actinocatenispora comari]|uniref:Uncharacterized protein n=1 Tax=Actinocatenispora comari TaxID=2807577 RepID=A0A8J4AE54_9ACTN|nr:hypothetical protein NUM_52050 [Actinocatenispora comari]
MCLYLRKRLYAAGAAQAPGTVREGPPACGLRPRRAEGRPAPGAAVDKHRQDQDELSGTVLRSPLRGHRL